MILLFCVALLTVYILKTFLENRKLPPGPYGIPFVGYMPFLGLSKQHLACWKLSKKYKSDTISIRFLSKNIIVLHDPRTIKQFFGKNELTGRMNEFPIDVLVGGNYGLVMTTGQHWHDQRRFALRHLRDMGMGKGRLEDTVVNEAQEIISIFKKQGSDPQNVTNKLNLAFFNVIWSLVSGKQFDYNDGTVLNMLRDQHQLAKHFAFLGLLLFMPWTKHFLPTWMIKTKSVSAFEETQHKWLEDEINEHKKNFDCKSNTDWIDYFIEEMENQKSNAESSFSDKQLLHAIKDFFFAGVETTSTSIRWGILFLASCQDVQNKVQQEIDSVVGRDRIPSLQDKPLLPYMEAFVAEVQRFGNIFPFGVQRTVIEDVNIDGYHVPKGSIVFGNLHACNYDPAKWKNPDNFDPENFIDENGKFIHNKEGFKPFGIGKRQCIGEGLARMELYIFLSTFVHQFNFRIPEGDKVTLEPELDNPFILREPKPFRVIIEAR